MLKYARCQINLVGEQTVESFFYCAKDKILFSGLQRNSRKGVDFVAEELNVNKIVLLKGTGFHLDTFSHQC